jgi:hypothetical protein
LGLPVLIGIWLPPDWFVSLIERTAPLDKLAAVRATPYDPVRTLYRALLVFDVVAILILAIGLGEFLYFEPPGQTTGVKATIVGVFQYNPATHSTSGSDRTTFARTDEFAAVVDWSTLPQNITVDARWYDSFEAIVGRVGPGTPAQLATQTTVPVGAPAPQQHNLPGQYVFVVERLQNGVPVEVLARRIIVVERS